MDEGIVVRYVHGHNKRLAMASSTCPTRTWFKKRTNSVSFCQWTVFDSYKAITFFQDSDRKQNHFIGLAPFLSLSGQLVFVIGGNCRKRRRLSMECHLRSDISDNGFDFLWTTNIADWSVAFELRVHSVLTPKWIRRRPSIFRQWSLLHFRQIWTITRPDAN